MTHESGRLKPFAKAVAMLPKQETQGPVAQLVSAPPCHGGGRGFKSRQGRSESDLYQGAL